jgi:hypothetical protein
MTTYCYLVDERGHLVHKLKTAELTWTLDWGPTESTEPTDPTTWDLDAVTHGGTGIRLAIYKKRDADVP